MESRCRSSASANFEWQINLNLIQFYFLRLVEKEDSISYLIGTLYAGSAGVQSGAYASVRTMRPSSGKDKQGHRSYRTVWSWSSYGYQLAYLCVLKTQTEEDVNVAEKHHVPKIKTAS
jgi:hypothetical protein